MSTKPGTKNAVNANLGNFHHTRPQRFTHREALRRITALESENARLLAKLKKAEEAVDVAFYCKQQIDTNPGYDTCVDAISDCVNEWHRKYIAALEGE